MAEGEKRKAKSGNRKWGWRKEKSEKLKVEIGKAEAEGEKRKAKSGNRKSGSGRRKAKS
jgi:hypothetical protein